jgi:hypothetical protein
MIVCVGKLSDLLAARMGASERQHFPSQIGHLCAVRINMAENGLIIASGGVNLCTWVIAIESAR